MTELWLVRHGQTDWNLAGRWQGQAQSAPGLNETGFAQARAARLPLMGQRFSALYTSDLLRARQTAEILARPLELTVNLEPRLREINLGKWEGLLAGEIMVQYPQELAERQRDPWHTRAPGGEAPADVAARVLEALAEITNQYPQQKVLIVSHGLSLAVIRCKAEGLPLEQVYEHVLANATPQRVVW